MAKIPIKMSVSLWLKGGVKLPDDFDTRKQWMVIPLMRGKEPILSKKTGKPRTIKVRVDEMKRKMQKRPQSAGVTRRGNKRFGGEVSRPAEVWRPEYANTIYRLCLARFDTLRIAETLGVRHEWLKEQLENNVSARRAWRKGTAEAAGDVAEALKKRAVGYDHPSEKIFYDKDVGVVRAKTKHHYPADVQAAIAFLQQHNPGQWRSGSTTELTGPDGGPIQTANLHADLKDIKNAEDAINAYLRMVGSKGAAVG